MMELLCELVSVLTAEQMYSTLAKLNWFNTPLSGDISNSEDKERYLTDTTEILKSRNCILCIPGETFGSIVEWSGDTYIKWEFVFSAWILFLGRLELFVDELTISSEDVEKVGMILKLIHSLLKQDETMYNELDVFCTMCPSVLARVISSNVEEKSDVIIYSISLLSILSRKDPSLYIQEMTDSNTYQRIQELSISLISNPKTLTRDNSKLSNTILGVLEAFRDIFINNPSHVSESFSLASIHFIQQLLRHNTPVTDNESLLNIHTQMLILLTNIHSKLPDWCNSETEGINSMGLLFSDFLLRERSIMELLFFDFNILKRLMESQQSDFLRNSCSNLIVLILTLLEKLLVKFEKRYFQLIESYIVRPVDSFIHVLSQITMSPHGSQLTLATLRLLKELCRHSEFSLMVCLGNSANALRSSLTTKLKSPPVMVSNQVRVEILHFVEQVLKFQPSFAEFIFGKDDHNTVSIVIELLDVYGKERVHASLLAACMRLLTVVWVTRRDCIDQESLANLWKNVQSILPLFYRKNMEYNEPIMDLSHGIVTVMMVEFYNSLFIEKIDSNFKDCISLFLNNTHMEHYFNLAFTIQSESSFIYSQKQRKFAVLLRQFMSILTVKAERIDFINSYYEKDNNKKFIYDITFDQLEFLVKNNKLYEVEEIFSEVLLCVG